MATDARRRMIQSAAVLMRERGVDATSFTDVLDHSGAPRGSIYHHFPGGKAQLVEEAARFAGDFIARGLVRALADDDPARAVQVFADQWRQILQSSDFSAGCAIVAATLAGDRSAGAREAAANAFAQWEDVLASALQHHGASEEAARSAATLIVAAVEGGVILARAQGSTAPLERVAGELRAMIERLLTP